MVRIGPVAAFAVWVMAAGSACTAAVNQAAVRVAPRTELSAPQANFSREDRARIERNCPLGRPRPNESFGFGPMRFVIRDGYVLQHSSRDKIPIWVCEGIAVAQLQGSLTRSNAFAPDPLLPKGERAELSDYRKSGFDRGHMAPAADQSVDAVLKRETFFLSNMVPQVGQMNQQIWATLEMKAREWLIARGGGHIITGGFFYDPKEDNAATADGLIEFDEIGAGKVAVPTHLYKIVVAKNAAGGVEAIAFVMENKSYDRPFDFGPFIVAIDLIEERAGIDFMPELDPGAEQRIEQATPALWTP